MKRPHQIERSKYFHGFLGRLQVVPPGGSSGASAPPSGTQEGPQPRDAAGGREGVSGQATRDHGGQFRGHQWAETVAISGQFRGRLRAVFHGRRHLAADKLDTGHLAGVVRDALATHHLAFDDVATVLRSYAHHYAAPLGDGSQMVERLLDEAGVPASTIRLGEYALNPSRQPGATLVDTSALNASVARAMEPLLHSQALTDAVRRMHETLGSAAAAIDTSQLRTPEMDVLNASVARAMEPLLQSTAIRSQCGVSRKSSAPRQQPPSRTPYCALSPTT